MENDKRAHIFCQPDEKNNSTLFDPNESCIIPTLKNISSCVLFLILAKVMMTPSCHGVAGRSLLSFWKFAKRFLLSKFLILQRVSFHIIKYIN